MFRRLLRDRAFLAGLVAFLLIGGHLLAEAGIADRDRQASMFDFSAECQAGALALLDDRRLLPEAPEDFLRSVDLAKTWPQSPGSAPAAPVAEEAYEAILAGRDGQSPPTRLDVIDRHITGLEHRQGMLAAYAASERASPVVADLSVAAPGPAFALHARRGALRERAGSQHGAFDAYQEALALDSSDAATDARVFVRWRTAALLQGQAKAAAIDTLAEAAGLMNAQIALPNCMTERRASLVWEMARLYERLDMPREAADLRDGLALRQSPRWRADPK